MQMAVVKPRWEHLDLVMSLRERLAEKHFVFKNNTIMEKEEEKKTIEQEQQLEEVNGGGPTKYIRDHGYVSIKRKFGQK